MKNRVLLIVFCIILITGSPVYASDPTSKDSNVIPVSFDLRNVDTDGDGVGDRCYVTPVRLQYPFGSCWAFAAIGAAEISLLGSVYDYDPEAWKTLDLSEKQLAYFAHEPLDDPSSTQNGEGRAPVDPADMSEIYGGGTPFLSTEMFAQGIGPSAEHPESLDVGEYYEYHGNSRMTTQEYIDGAFRNFCYSSEDDWTIPEEYRFYQDYILVDAHILPNPAAHDENGQYCYDAAATEAIKRELLEKRGVMIGFCADSYNQQTLTGEEGKYISSNWAHYNWDGAASNHGVTIIGWDDNYPKENFLEEHQPPEDGAWLVKNSWGAGTEEFPAYGRGNWGLENDEGIQTGYFWISYYDRSMTDPESLELDIALAPQDIEQYDYMQVDSLYSQTFAEPVSMANIFQADHSKILSAISCITAAEETQVRFRVYLLKEDYQSPEDGLLAAEGTVSYDHAGYHRILLDDNCLQKGQSFSVIETLTDKDGNYQAIMPMAGGFIGLNNQMAILNEKESYFQEGGEWQDYRQTADAMISAILTPDQAEIATLSYDNFPIKAYSHRVPGDVSIELVHAADAICVVDGLNQDLYHLQFTGIDAFDVGNPDITWEILPGSEELVEIEPKKEGAELSVTAKAPGTALLSVNVEGIGTTVFSIAVSSGYIASATPMTPQPLYTGEEIKPYVFVFTDNRIALTEGEHYQVEYFDNITCGMGRAEVTGIGACANPEDPSPVISYFSIIPDKPEIASLEAEDGEIQICVEELPEAGIDGYEMQYRLKGTAEWTSVPFEAGENNVSVNGLTPGEYEVHVRAFVDNTKAPVPDSYRTVEYGIFNDISIVDVE